MRIQCIIESPTVQRKIFWIRRSACLEIERVAAQEILLLGLKISEARDVTVSGRVVGRSRFAANFGHHRLYGLCDVELVMQIMAQYAARIRNSRIEQDTRA